MSSEFQTSRRKVSGLVDSNLKTLGKYDIARYLGAGGMGTVFLATDRELNRTVALKVLSRERAENAILVRRFKAEGQAAAVLRDENIVGVYEAGEADGYFYIALEYVDGTDVHKLLRKRQRLPVKRSIEIIKQIASALQHAHQKRLVHRDIKPANILITRDGTAKLTDLGLARSLDNTLDTSITRDGTTVGTVDYMSPEQAADSKSTDIRSDLYSLGCSWYHMVTGRPPFPEGDLTNKLAAHAKTPPPDPREFNDKVPEAVVAVIHRLMAKNPRDRYQNPQQLLEDLANPSIALAQDSNNLLAVLLEEEPEVFQEEEDDDDSIVVQDESQSTLLKRKHQDESTSSTSIDTVKAKNSPEWQSTGSESVPIPVPDSVVIRKWDTSKKKPVKEKQKKTNRRKQPTEADSDAESPIESTETGKKILSAKSAQKAQPQKVRPQRVTPATKSTEHSEPERQTTTSTSKTRNKTKQQQSASKGTSTPQKQTTGKQPTPAKRPLPPKLVNREPDQNEGPRIRIDLDWKKLALMLGVPLLLGGLIWYAYTSLQRKTPEPFVNPYANDQSASPDSANGVAEIGSGEVPLKQGSKGEEEASETVAVNSVESGAPVTSESQPDSTLPVWMLPEWKHPRPIRQNKILVQRGSSTTTTEAPNLHLALRGSPRQDLLVDVSNVVRQPLHATDIRVNRSLRIAANQGSPLFTINPNHESDVGTRRDGWLTFSQGAVEIHGVHFLICTTDDSNPWTLFRLGGTDLILSDCSITVLGNGAVNLFQGAPQSDNPNRILMKNCVVRGKQISIEKNMEGGFYAENSMFLSESGILWSRDASSARRAGSLAFSQCTILTNGTAFDLSLSDQKQRSKSPNFKIGFDRSWIGGLQGDQGTAFRFRAWPEILAQSSSSLEQAGIQLALINHHFSSLGQYVEIDQSSTGTAKLDHWDAWKSFWKNEKYPAGRAEFNSDAIADRDVWELDASQLASLVTADSTLPGRFNTFVGSDPAKLAELDSQDLNRELTLLSFKPVEKVTTRPADQTVRFELSGKRGLAEFLNSDQCPDGSVVLCTGSGLVRLPILHLDHRRLTLRFESESGKSLKIQPESSQLNDPWITVAGGSLEIQQAVFDLPRLRGTPDTAQFVQVQDGGSLVLRNSNVTGKSGGRSKVPFISNRSNNESSEQTARVTIVDSMIHAQGPLIEAAEPFTKIHIDNSILISSADLLAIRRHSATSQFVLNRCTLSYAGTFVDLNGNVSIEKLPLLINETVFIQPVYSSEHRCLVTGESMRTIRSLVDWNELQTAHASTPETLISGSDELRGEFPYKWQLFWGQDRILNVITGPQSVLVESADLDSRSISPEDLTLLDDCVAAKWNDLGKPIGADTRKVGPERREPPVEEEQKPPAKPTIPPASF